MRARNSSTSLGGIFGIVHTNADVPGGHTAKTLLDQMLYAHKDYLPQFADKIKEIEENQAEDVQYIDELMKSN